MSATASSSSAGSSVPKRFCSISERAARAWASARAHTRAFGMPVVHGARDVDADGEQLPQRLLLALLSEQLDEAIRTLSHVVECPKDVVAGSKLSSSRLSPARYCSAASRICPRSAAR